MFVYFKMVLCCSFHFSDFMSLSFSASSRIPSRIKSPHRRGSFLRAREAVACQIENYLTPFFFSKGRPVNIAEVALRMHLYLSVIQACLASSALPRSSPSLQVPFMLLSQLWLLLVRSQNEAVVSIITVARPVISLYQPLS